MSHRAVVFGIRLGCVCEQFACFARTVIVATLVVVAAAAVVVF